MDRISCVRGTDIATALELSDRQYISGRLQRPQALAHLDDGELEIGISTYDASVEDLPHMHPQAREYQYVLDGLIRVLDLVTGEAWEFGSGDLFVVDRGCGYVARAKPGTRILFIKNPGGNDKVVLSLDEGQQQWADSVQAEFSR